MAEDLVIRVAVEGQHQAVSDLDKVAAAQKKLTNNGGQPIVTGPMVGGPEGAQPTLTWMQSAKARINAMQSDARKLAEGHEIVLTKTQAWANRAINHMGMLHSAIAPVDRAIRSMWQSFESGARNALAAVGALSLGGFVTFGAKLAIADEQTAMSFAALARNEKLGASILREVDTWAMQKGNPFGTDPAENAAKSLLAAGIKPTAIVSTLNALGNTASTSGGGDHTLEQFASQLQWMQESQTITSRNIAAFRAADIPILQILADRFTGGDTYRMSRRLDAGGGRSIFRQLGGVEGFTKLLGDYYPNGMTMESQTVMGMLRETKKRTLTSVRESFAPALEPLKGIISGVQPSIDKLAGAFGRLFSNVFERLARVNWERQLSRAANIVDRITASLAWGEKHAKGIGAALVAAYIAKGSTTMGMSTFSAISTFAKEGSPLAANAGVYGLYAAGIVAALALIAVGLRLAYTHSESFRKSWDKVWNIASRSAAIVGKLIVTFGKLAWIFEGPMLKSLGKMSFYIVDKIAWAADKMLKPFESLVGYLDAAVDKLTKFLDLLPGGKGGESGSMRFGKGLMKGLTVATMGPLGAAMNLFGDTSTPIYPHSMDFDRSINVPGSRMITSAIRTTNLGNANSDHRYGAYDVAGSGLHAYAAAVAAKGGVAKMHGSHLHVVPPMGDTSAPFYRRNSSDAAVIQQWDVTINAYKDEEFERRVREIIEKANRSTKERKTAYDRKVVSIG